MFIYNFIYIIFNILLAFFVVLWYNKHCVFDFRSFAAKVRKANIMAKKQRLIRLTGAVVLLITVISVVFSLCLSAMGEGAGGGAGAAMQGSSITKLDGSAKPNLENYFGSSVQKLPSTVKESDEISLIIEMPTNTLLSAYNNSKSDLTLSEFAKSDEGLKIKSEIDFEAKRFKRLLDNADIRYTDGLSYDTVLAGFEIVIKARDFEDVCDVIGNKATVVVGEEYEAAETKLVNNKVDVQDTGIFNSEGFGYDGTGMLVAVLDTGLDYYHSAFSELNFDSTGMRVTIDTVRDMLDECNTSAESKVPGLTAEDVYISTKVPYGFDYADGDSDVFPLLSNHGTHVAGVIAGDDDVITGVAPNAQLAIFKIFSDVQATARTSWILAALDDCVNLGVDVINMSIGTGCGFSRENDKEWTAGVYERIRNQGISMVVAASNSFNSTYGSEKNGNLGLTSNPDSATVGSPSTYKGTLSVASIEGAKTPYLTYNGKIIYFIESTDRVAEEKNFLDDILEDGQTRAELEYVTIPGAGDNSDYSGIDVTGKIVLVRRGYTSFEDKANIAEAKGALGVIIYNNVSGDIKMNVGETKIAVASISQDDGEMLAEAGSGTIIIDRSQTSGPFMSDFSSWGPTPSLEIKPEITAHGGSILSSVPGQSYDRISGTSMASPNVAGVTALLRQYVKTNYQKITGEAFNDSYEHRVKLTELVNQLMMSTADIVINKNGLPYAVRKQGAGLANLTASAKTTAYIITYDRTKTAFTEQAAMDKTKIELGDDPDKTGVYTLNFSVKNFGTSSLTYSLSTYVLTEGVSETKTSHNETTVTEEAYELTGAEVSFTVTGGTKDGSRLTVAAGATANVTLTIKLTDENKKYLDESFENGMYVEGFVKLDGEGGAVKLGAPFLAFYGDWTEAPLFDLDYFETNKDEIDDAIDIYDKNLADAYATRPIGGINSDYVSYLGSYYYEQNPDNRLIAADRAHISLSNHTDSINSISYVWAGMLRNAEKIDIVITEDATGEVVYKTTDTWVRKSYGDGGSIYPSNVDVDFSAIEHNLKNNTAYTVTLTGKLHYGDGGLETNDNNTFTFPFVTDFEAPIVTDCEFYTEYDRSEKKTRLFARVAVYDNHYAMSMLFGTVKYNASLGDLEYVAFERYMTPVYSDFNTTNYVVYELTDCLGDIMQSYNKNTFTVYCYDYALNNAAYEIALPDDFTAFFFNESSNETLETLDLGGGNTLDVKLELRPNEVYTLAPSVYPEGEWSEFLTYSSSNSKVAKIVGNKVLALSEGYTKITAKITDPENPSQEALEASFGLKVAGRAYTKPCADKFDVYGYNVLKAFFKLNSEDRDIGATGDTMMFNGDNLTLKMYPSESVRLLYDLVAYFPADTKVEFKSSRSEYATVDENGIVTAVAEGNANITVKVTVEGSRTSITKTIKVEVKEPWVTSGPSLAGYYGAGEGNGGKVIFPSNIAVTEIGQYAFSNFNYIPKTEDDEISDEVPETTKIWFVGDSEFITKVKEVVIPEGVERIGPYAFAGLSALTKVTLPSTLETIDYGAFYGCTALEVVEGLENVKFINQGAFQNCSLKGDANGKITLTKAVAISDYAFAGNKALKEIVLENDTRSVGAYAFAGCSALESVTIKAEWIKLGKYVFSDCKKLTSVSVNAAVIPEGAFNECTALKTVTLGKDVSVIGAYAFRNTGVEKFNVLEGNRTFTVGNNLPLILDSNGMRIVLVAPALTELPTGFDVSKITSIGNAAFSGSKITSVSLPYVTEIGDYAFSYAENLSSVDFAALKSVGKYAFEATALTSVPVDITKETKLGSYVFLSSDITSVNFGNAWLDGKVGYEIPEGAFMNCLSLTSVVLGDGVKVGRSAFMISSDNYSFASYEYNKKVWNAETESYDTRKMNVYYYVFLSSLESLEIGDGVTLGDYAFHGASKLQTATLGNGTVIGDYAFYNCKSLATLDLSKVKSIGDYAFSGGVYYQYDANPLESAASIFVTNEGNYAFSYYTPALVSVDLSSLEELGNYAFSYCRELSSVTLGASLTKVPEAAFMACENLATIGGTGLSKLESVGDYAFAEAAFSTADLSSATKIGEYAFCYNTELLSVKFAEGAEILEGAFSNCESLVGLIDESGVKKIGDYAFAYTSVRDADLTALESLGKEAFLRVDYKPTEATESFTVILGDKLSEIGDNPFGNFKVAPFTTEAKESFGGKDYTYVTDTFDIGESIKIIDGSIYRVAKNGLVLITWAGGERAEVAEGTVRISDYAFASSDIVTAVLPYTVASIGHKAFYNCRSLEAVSFASYNAPILEEEYNEDYYNTLENIPGKGNYGYDNYDGKPVDVSGLELVPYFIWNAQASTTLVRYGANFNGNIGHIDEKITMIRPVNGQNYDSFTFLQYFGITVDGGAAADDLTLSVIEAISKIPTEIKDITLSTKPTVTAARALYNKIASLEQRALVSNFDILTKAESRISDLEYLAGGGSSEPEVTPPTDTPSTPTPSPDDTTPTPEPEKKDNTVLIFSIVLGSVIALLGAALAVFVVLYVKARDIPFYSASEKPAKAAAEDSGEPEAISDDDEILLSESEEENEKED